MVEPPGRSEFDRVAAYGRAAREVAPVPGGRGPVPGATFRPAFSGPASRQAEGPGVTDARTSGSGGTLYLVATPIGNLEDVTHRALRILSEVSVVAAEDTRHTRRLLDRYGISVPVISLFEHNERARIPGIVRR